MTLKDLLAIFGAIFIVAMVCILLVVLVCYIKEGIDILKYRYRLKHRFDKPPTAKCYCVDCILHDNESGRCYRFEMASGYYHTADNWFCWEANPRSKDV